MTEQQVIDQLKSYKRIVARMKVLENYSIGCGIQLSTLAEDDRLQELHRKLRGMPSYIYLNKHEQKLETVAHAYLTRYPTGTRSQLNEIRQVNAVDDEDEKLLKELQRKIQKVIEARTGTVAVDGFEAVLERMSELQDLQAEKAQIDGVLEALEEYKPQHAKLLRLRHVDDLQAGEVAKELGVVRKTFERWHPKAIEEYARLSAMS